MKTATPSTPPRLQWPTLGTAVKLVFAHYTNGNLAVGSLTDEDGYDEPWADLSTNLAGTSPAADQFYCRTHSESEGLMAALIEQGFATDTGPRQQPTGSFVEFPLLKLTELAKSWAPTGFFAT